MKVRIIALVTAGILGLSGCDDGTGPAAGSGAGSGGADVASLAGSYNLNQAECAAANSLTRLTITGNDFRFYEASCTLTEYDAATGATTLACTGEGTSFRRYIGLQSAPGQLRMSDDGVTLTYFRCPAPA